MREIFRHKVQHKNKSMSQKYRTTLPLNPYLQDLISNSPFLLPYISFKTGLENLMMGEITSLSWSVFVFSSPIWVLMLSYCKGEATWKLSLPFSVRVVGLSVMQTWLLNNSLFWISRSSPYFVITLFNLLYSWQRPQAIWSESLHLICYLNGQHGPIFPAWDHLFDPEQGNKFLIFVQCRRWSRQKRQETVKVDVLQTQLAFFSSSWEKWVILHFCPSEIFLLYSKYFIDQACLVKKAE